MLPGVVRQTGAAAHRVARAVVEEFEPGFGNHLVFEVDRNDAKIMAHDQRTVT